MAKVLHSVTMSLVGFIAGPGGDMSWMTQYFGPDPEMSGLIDQIGSLLVGRRTDDGDDPNRGNEGEGKAFGGGWEGPQCIVTHRVPEKSSADEYFVDVNVLGADIDHPGGHTVGLERISATSAPMATNLWFRVA